MTGQRAHRPQLAPQAHTAVFGEGPESFAATAVEVFAAARDSGSALLLMSDDPDPRVLEALPDRDDLLAEGRLRLVRTADAYPDRDPARLVEAFDGVLRGALADGFHGMRVVAENTSLVRGGDGAFADWLAWEHATSHWQHRNPVVGVCWFDRTTLDDARVARLAQVHADAHGVPTPAFRVLRHDSGFRLVGDVDAHDVPRLVELLAATPADAERVVDLAGAGYVHHTAFTALAVPAGAVRPLVVTGARRVHRRVWDALGDHTDRVALG